MVLGLPVTVTTPKFVSADMGIGAVSTAGGIIGADFFAYNIIARAGWTGNTALAAGMISKGVLGALCFIGAGKTTGGVQKLLYFASIGSVSGIAIDVYRWYKPGPEESAVVRAARARAVRAPVAVRRAPAPVARRAETPSGEAIGGF